MNKKYLFGAEVNKIQQTLFAASLQRQVVGGSRLLAVFSQQAGKKAEEQFQATQVMVSDGGKFWIEFGGKEKGEEFGRFLANSYHLLLDGSISVAPPQLYDRDKPVCPPDTSHCGELLPCFKCAKDKVERELNGIKLSRHQPIAIPHAPTTAFCDSSGFGLAGHYRPILAGDETPSSGTPPKQTRREMKYMSAVAYTMKEVGYVTKKGRKPKSDEPTDEDFLGKIARHLAPKLYEQKRRWAYSPEEVACFDMARRNLAYLVADGNNMGMYFSYCRTPEELQQLSKLVNETIQKAIAAPILHLISRFEEVIEPQTIGYIPLLPLIVAGDDVFLMLPAPYALDYARQFCLAFEREMQENQLVKDLVQLAEKAEKKGKLPTMSASVVFCKESYPYSLAHQHGDDLLKQTKRIVKTVEEVISAVSFDIIVGSELVKKQTAGKYRAGLTTYWAVKYNGNSSFPLSDEACAAAGDLQTLLNQRLIFKRIPSKRRAEIRQLYDSAKLQLDQSVWEAKMKWVRERIETTHSTMHREILDDALRKLGNSNSQGEDDPGRWLAVKRSGASWQAQGLPDLLEVWPYAQLLNCPLSEYEEERAQ